MLIRLGKKHGSTNKTGLPQTIFLALNIFENVYGLEAIKALIVFTSTPIITLGVLNTLEKTKGFWARKLTVLGVSRIMENYISPP